MTASTQEQVSIQFISFVCFRSVFLTRLVLEYKSMQWAVLIKKHAEVVLCGTLQGMLRRGQLTGHRTERSNLISSEKNSKL